MTNFNDIDVSPQTCPPSEPILPIITSVKDLERLLSSVELVPSAKEEAINEFKVRHQSDKAAIKVVSQSGNVNVSQVHKARNKVIKTPGSRLLTPEELKSLGIRTPFECPTHYIKHCVHKDYVQPLRLSTGETVTYDLCREDLAFLEGVVDSLGPDHLAVSSALENNFMKLIDQMEHGTGHGQPISIDSALALAASLNHLPLYIARAIHQHWLDRRQILQKPLLRLYWTSPPPNVPAQFHVFRTKVGSKERMSLRRPRRSVQEASHKMDFVMSDLKRVEKILKNLMRRDRQKMLLSELNACIFDQMRHEMIDPTYVNPHWTYLVKSKLQHLQIGQHEETTKVAKAEEWKDQHSPSRSSPYSSGPHIPSTISLPCKQASSKALDIPFPRTFTQPLWTVRYDGIPWVESLSPGDYKDAEIDLVLPASTETAGLQEMDSPNISQHIEQYATEYPRQVDPIPIGATLEGHLSQQGPLLHSIKQLRFLKAMASLSHIRNVMSGGSKVLLNNAEHEASHSAFKITGLTTATK
eukprot:Blabericola_migrator_1__10719@NODE_612_length_7289_cov_45_683606_g445_i0_p2_GENE_NODE_612_length_7289_cov_45_683606_g445_i0NODE_612_length_7289_cov_45_683606_g445_i0_p2_ORF_typecomplete_len526_score54_20EPL1/PF10513_9/0_019CCDC167/PF15188_6/2_1e03CCDC167/PF15188_6/0_68_NODE_612_length_7289_cov_45_683606_g445_i034475024